MEIQTNTPLENEFDVLAKAGIEAFHLLALGQINEEEYNDLMALLYRQEELQRSLMLIDNRSPELNKFLKES